jgi:hypothetical protein
MAIVVVSALAVGSYTGINSFLTMDRSRTTVEGPSGDTAYSFEWQPGAYPVIAEGTFQDQRWTVEVIEDPDRAHPEDTESDNPEIDLWFDGENRGGGTFETYQGWDIVAEPFHSQIDELKGDGTEFVMGMVDSSVSALSIELEDGRTFPAAIFDGGNRPLPSTNYYLAFLPTGSTGELVAKNGSGNVLGRATLGPEPASPDFTIECPPPPGSVDGPPSQFAFEPSAGTYPVIAEGTFHDQRWTVKVIEDPDRAHPEDTESDNPEIELWIDGQDRGGGSFETYEGWDIVNEPFHSQLDDGTEFVMGMVDTSVSTLSIELKDGRTFPAAIFDGGDRPLPDTNYYLAFLPTGSTGDLVAKDESGDVLGQSSLDRLNRMICPSYQPTS